ncbi:MAG: lactoylglutathione lyase [Hyphomonadaceae bacterium]|nr:MAG: lactoylglutathione lyase [Hyphomonadaceae bacterium]KAF0186733.1 MAG: lactoylglutathione lyase [Hyphomonadaceae bacterium]
MRYLHTMVRVTDLDAALKFWVDALGLVLARRIDNEQGKFSLVFLCAPYDLENAKINQAPLVELTYNWPRENGAEVLTSGRNFGHLAYQVDDIYAICARLQAQGIVINRPPRDGHMAFVRSPDNISIELLQKGPNLPPQEPWLSMQNIGEW